ncbi:MAG: hypothetical protein Q8R18_06220 [bacterium]|nr:hypothetical protein [bacterium]
MAPKYAYTAISNYVEGNVGNRIIEIYKHLDRFIGENGPVIEDIQQRTRIMDNLPFGKLKRSIIEDSLRNDLTSAKKGLAIYNRIYGRTDLYLGLMTSNFKLPEFLKNNNIPADQISYFQSELQLYWEATYGLHLNHLERCKIILDKLRNILYQEVKFLEKIPQESYLIAVDDNDILRALFQEERNTFWLLAQTAQMKTEETNQLKNIVKTQIQKTQVEVKAFANIVKSGVGKDIEASRTLLEKSIITLTYLIGALKIISEIPKTFKKKVLLNIFNRVTDEERLSNSGKVLLAEAIELLAS